MNTYLKSKHRLGTDASEPKENPQPPIQAAPKGEWKGVLKSVGVFNALGCINVTRGGCHRDWCWLTGMGGVIIHRGYSAPPEKDMSTITNRIDAATRGRARKHTYGNKWSEALIRNENNAGTSTNENVHNGSSNIIDNYQLGRSIKLVTRKKDVRAWLCGMG